MMRLLLLTLLLSANSLAHNTVRHSDVRRKHNVLALQVEHPKSEFYQFWRRLSDSESGDSNDNSNEDDAYNNDDNINVFYRIEEDFLDMWGSPPNEWNGENWEVFGGFLFIVLFSLSLCMGCCCLLPLWSPREDPMAQKPLGNKNNNEFESEPPTDDETTHGAISSNDMLNNQQDLPSNTEKSITDASSVGYLTSASLDPKRAPHAHLDKTLSYDTSGSGYNTAVSPRGAKKKRRSLWSQRAAVWEEVLSVWSEFLGCSDEKQDQPYDKFKEPVLTTSMRNKSRSRSRKSRSSRKYKAPSFHKESDMEYEKAPSSHKVGKHDGTVV